MAMRWRSSRQFLRFGCNDMVSLATLCPVVSVTRILSTESFDDNSTRIPIDGEWRKKSMRTASNPQCESSGSLFLPSVSADVGYNGLPEFGVEAMYSTVSNHCRSSRNLTISKAEVGRWMKSRSLSARSLGTMVREEVEEDGEVLLLRYLEKLKNYEKEGVPRGAGEDSDSGFDLERMKRLLSRLGNPLSSYPVVHVAGTKGKGSTVSFISSILRAAGLRVGTYTSPHVTSIRERITAGRNEGPISANSLKRLMTDLQATIDKAIAEESGLLSHFEVLTALAFAHFAREKVDVAVVETGLGGARDATNVISADELAVAVIVGIGYEHLAALGGTLDSIALAKSGIIKEKRPVIVGPQKYSQIYDVLKKVAAAKLAPLTSVPRSLENCKTGIFYTPSGHPFQLCDLTIQNPPGIGFGALNEEWKLENVKLRVLGAHQQENALTAVYSLLSLRHQGWKIPDSAIRMGLEATTIPGRFQVVESDSSKALGCLSARLILDGAHTEDSAIALAKTLREGFPDASLAFVVAMASDKDRHSFARILLTKAKPDVVVTTRVPVAESYSRCCTTQELAECWSQTAQALNLPYHSETSKQKSRQGFFSYGSSEHQQCGVKILSKEEAFKGNVESLLVCSVEPINSAISKAAAALESRHSGSNKELIVCVAGSLHAVAATLTLIQESRNQY